MRRRRGVLIGAGLLVLALTGGGFAAWRSIPYVPPAGSAARPASVARQMAYVERWAKRRNPDYGDLAGTDCVNFTSQALLARGWAMDGRWGTSTSLGRRAYAPAWVSSTAMMRWLTSRPDLAVAVDASQVRLGDLAQFDWDGSGDRDHTAIVSRVSDDGGGIRIAVAEHSPEGLYDDVAERLAEHPGTARVHYWHLLQ